MEEEQRSFEDGSNRVFPSKCERKREKKKKKERSVSCRQYLCRNPYRAGVEDAVIKIDCLMCVFAQCVRSFEPFKQSVQRQEDCSGAKLCLS